MLLVELRVLDFTVKRCAGFVTDDITLAISADPFLND